MEEKLNGIVLSSVSYGENDKIINVFTMEKGTVSAMVKGVKKKSAKLKFVSEPFAFAEFIFAEKAGRRTVTGATLLDSFYSLREDIVKYFCAGTVLEFCRKFAKENIVSAELFVLSIDTLKKIAYSSNAPRKELSFFLIKALGLVGYGLNVEGCFKCGKIPTARIFFDCFSGGFLCQDCADSTVREINLSTFINLKNISENLAEVSEEQALKTLRLLDFYLENKAEEKLGSLKELLQMPVV